MDMYMSGWTELWDIISPATCPEDLWDDEDDCDDYDDCDQASTATLTASQV